MSWELHCADVMRFQWQGAPFHAVLCDPPFGILEEGWESGIAADPGLWRQISDWLLPGAILLAFSAPRVYHRVCAALEAAGFEILPFIGWLHAQGFPKVKAIEAPGWEEHRPCKGALKPVLDPIVCAQKPFLGPKGEGMLQHGTGGFWIEGARLARWPANFCATHDPGCQPKGLRELKPYPINRWADGAKPFGGGAGHPYQTTFIQPRSTMAYSCVSECPVQGIDRADLYPVFGYSEELDFPLVAVSRVRTEGGKAVLHAARKPVELTRWLATLLLPPPAYAPRRIFVPFAGTGSEMLGAILAGWELVVGIELDASYCEVARARLQAGLS